MCHSHNLRCIILLAKKISYPMGSLGDKPSAQQSSGFPCVTWLGHLKIGHFAIPGDENGRPGIFPATLAFVYHDIWVSMRVPWSIGYMITAASKNGGLLLDGVCHWMPCIITTRVYFNVQWFCTVFFSFFIWYLTFVEVVYTLYWFMYNTILSLCSFQIPVRHKYVFVLQLYKVCTYSLKNTLGGGV